jgi:hypothetical protein
LSRPTASWTHDAAESQCTISLGNKTGQGCRQVLDAEREEPRVRLQTPSCLLNHSLFYVEEKKT